MIITTSGAIIFFNHKVNSFYSCSFFYNYTGEWVESLLVPLDKILLYEVGE